LEDDKPYYKKWWFGNQPIKNSGWTSRDLERSISTTITVATYWTSWDVPGESFPLELPRLVSIFPFGIMITPRYNSGSSEVSSELKKWWLRTEPFFVFLRGENGKFVLFLPKIMVQWQMAIFER